MGFFLSLATETVLPFIFKVLGFLLYHWAFSMAFVAGFVAISGVEWTYRLVALALTMIGSALWGGKMKLNIGT